MNMNFTAHQLLFYLFSTMAVLSGLWVILSKNSVRSVLSLIFTFFNVAAIWMLLEAEFLAIVLVLVYVGAVMVLFLFVVMMIDVESPETTPSAFMRFWPLGVLAGGVLLAMMILVIDHHYSLHIIFNPESLPANYSDVKVLGNLLYTEFLLPFEIAGVILLVAMIAAIGLTFRGPRHQKTQIPSEQIQVTKQERLRIVSMPTQQGESV